MIKNIRINKVENGWIFLHDSVPPYKALTNRDEELEYGVNITHVFNDADGAINHVIALLKLDE